MRPYGSVSAALILGAVILGVAPQARALVFQTVQPTASSLSDPVWGQGITLNVGATVPDASIPSTVQG